MTTTPKTEPYQLWKVLPDGRWEFLFDSHTVADFSKCEQYFDYRHLQHLRSRGRGGAAMNIGSWWSRCMEYLYSHLKNAQDKIELAPLTDHHLNEVYGPPTMADALKYAAAAWSELNMDELEKTSPKAWKTFKGRDGAIVMTSRYYETTFQHDVYNWRIIAVEYGFGLRHEVLVGENDQVVVYYMGKPDLVVLSKGDDQLMPVDHKTTDYIKGDTQKKYKPHPQTVGYIYAVNTLAKTLGIERKLCDRCCINVGARNEPTDKPRDGGPPKPRFTRVYPCYNPQEVEEWRQALVAKASAMRSAIEGEFFFRNESACHLYAGCEFRGICAVPLASRNIIIKANYDEAEPWVPYSISSDEDEE